MPESLFYCGKAPPPRDASRATQLMLVGPQQNINRGIEDIEAWMVSEVPNHPRDLLDIATYVFVADRMIGRGGETLPNMGSDWRRRFHLCVAVREPERWNAPHVKAALEELVGLVSDDIYRFTFSNSDELPAFPSLPLKKGDTPRQDQVLLFSGGLDSLFQGDDRIVLVSHRSSDWVFSRQRELANALASRFPGRVRHVPVEITMSDRLHDAEYTQRTRTFLFSAIGCVIAEMLGCNRIRFFENGIISFNLPIAPQIVGSRATRSTHPLVLSKMTAFANQMLGHPFDVANPFIWHTKAEVLRFINEYGQADLIEHSISCTRIRKATQRAHCGECTQCLQRRFAALAAGLAEEDPIDGYDVELLAQDRNERSMALNLVSSALEFPRLSPTGFMNKYAGEVLRAARGFSDETVESVVQRSYELHRRYGSEVGEVIDNAIRHYAPNIREKTLPPGCLLRAVIADERVEVDRTPLEIPYVTETREPDTRDFGHTTRIQLAVDEDRKQLVIDGLGPVGTTGHFELVSILAAQHRADRTAGLKPDNHVFVPTERLMDALDINSETTLRQQIGKFRRRLVILVREGWGIALSRSAVVENRSGIGYRLNPEVVLIDASELE